MESIEITSTDGMTAAAATLPVVLVYVIGILADRRGKWLTDMTCVGCT